MRSSGGAKTLALKTIAQVEEYEERALLALEGFAACRSFNSFQEDNLTEDINYSEDEGENLESGCRFTASRGWLQAYQGCGADQEAAAHRD